MSSRLIRDSLQDSIDLLMSIIQVEIGSIKQIGEMLIETFSKGKSSFVFGTGVSNLNAQNFASGMLGISNKIQSALPVTILGQESSVSSAFASAQEYENIFIHYVEAFVKKDDIVIGFSASGSNQAVLNGLEKARSLGAKTIGFTGDNPSQLSTYCDVVVSLPSQNFKRINEAHFILINILVEYIEQFYFKDSTNPEHISEENEPKI